MGEWIRFKGKRIQIYHNYYKRSGFYSYLKKNILGLIIGLVALLGLLYIINFHFIDFKSFFENITTKYSPRHILIIFFTSETILGLILEYPR